MDRVRFSGDAQIAKTSLGRLESLISFSIVSSSLTFATNNKLENLQILCPNCHTMTDNYRGKNIGKTKIIEGV